MFGDLFKKKRVRTTDAERDLKILEGQSILLAAATSAADAANSVTKQIRSKLHDTLQQLDATSRILNDALVICDTTGVIQYVNPSFEKLFGSTSTDTVGRYIGSMIHSESHDLSQAKNIWKLLVEVEKEDTQESVYAFVGDKHVAIDINHTKLDRSDGTSIILMVIRDIEKTNFLYKAIFDSSFDGIIVVKNEKIVASNRKAAKLFGYTEKQLSKKAIDSVFIGNSVDLINDVNTVHDGSTDLYHKDGHIMNICFTTTPIVWDEEQATLITIKDNREKGSSAAEKMVCCFDKDFFITFANKAFTKNYGITGSVVGNDIRSVLPKEESDPLVISLNSLSKDSPTRKMRLVTYKDGKNITQDWIDHANFDDGDVEYQRIGTIM